MSILDNVTGFTKGKSEKGRCLREIEINSDKKKTSYLLVLNPHPQSFPRRRKDALPINHLVLQMVPLIRGEI
ncbi:MAG: hypothetical protein CL607_11670 [Anaerolineaceae bacterium]|nr:hypothetical protein [Anaerolineaceae bacterium]